MPSGSWTRREFNRNALFAAAGASRFGAQEPAEEKAAPVALVKLPDRINAMRTAFDLLEHAPLEGKDIYLKGNFTSADPYPVTSHPDALKGVVGLLRSRSCARILLAERSTIGTTRSVWDKLGITSLARSMDVTLVALDDMPAGEWRTELLPGSHWKNGIEVPKFLTRETCVVQICNLKTHRFGGLFSASLKNSIGLIAKHSTAGPRYNYMAELHASPHQRLMIAEVNQVCAPALVIMDAMRVFIDAGPDRGEVASPEVVVMSQDRVAVDAVGVALLRIYGAAAPLNRGNIFDQEQLKRAAELGLGVKSGKAIRFLTPDDPSALIVSQIEGVLSEASERNKP